jgi:hypothetical protein
MLFTFQKAVEIPVKLVLDLDEGNFSRTSFTGISTALMIR